MPAWNGYFDHRRNPCLRIKVAGDSKSIELEAIIDTGFSGFLLMPVPQALPLGLAVVGTTTANMADGSRSAMVTAMGEIQFAGRKEIGLFNLPSSAPGTLIGLDFLRQFKLALLITSSQIVLVDESDFDEMARKSKQRIQDSGPKQSS